MKCTPFALANALWRLARVRAIARKRLPAVGPIGLVALPACENSLKQS